MVHLLTTRVIPKWDEPPSILPYILDMVIGMIHGEEGKTTLACKSHLGSVVYNPCIF